jgi:hypothetical protein
MKNKYFILSALSLFTLACKKNLPELPNAEVPVFYSEMSSPSLNLNLRAGINGISFSEEISVDNQVKHYSGMLEKPDTLFRINFFAGEVFKAMNSESFMGITAVSPVSLSSQSLAQVASSDLLDSQFDISSFTVNQSDLTDAIDIQNPGIYTIGLAAQRDGMNFESSNVAVIGYDNPYKFELVGNINSSGPGVIIEGQIQNSSTNIEKIEWTCGSNAQTTTGTQVQFPPAGSNNLLVAKVTFEDGVERTRSIGLGLENAPKIEDIIYSLETYSTISFSSKIEVILETNNETYSSKFATDFTEGEPILNVINKSFYTDPVTKQEALLIHATGLLYLKNTQSNETIPVQINLQIGLPISF